LGCCEEAKVTKYRWVTPTELVALQAEAAEADAAVFALAGRGLDLVANLRLKPPVRGLGNHAVLTAPCWGNQIDPDVVALLKAEERTGEARTGEVGAFQLRPAHEQTA
jgi:hypothetical protein